MNAVTLKNGFLGFRVPREEELIIRASEVAKFRYEGLKPWRPDGPCCRYYIGDYPHIEMSCNAPGVSLTLTLDQLTMALAHELGHAIADWSKPYHELKQALVSTDRRVKLEREWDAWDSARCLLQDIGWDNWLLFNEFMLICVGSHEQYYNGGK